MESITFCTFKKQVDCKHRKNYKTLIGKSNLKTKFNNFVSDLTSTNALIPVRVPVAVSIA